MGRPAFPSDLTDEQRALVEPLFLPPAVTGRPRTECRVIVNAILYQSRTGCQWRHHLPHDLPARSTVHAWFSRWRADGTWDQVVDTLRAKVRNCHGRADEPTAGILDSQSVPNAGLADEVGYDAGKGIRGRKRHVLVDSLGLVIAVAVTSA
jgi:putative transposase